MTPKTILFVAHSSGLYGADRSLFSLVSELNRKGKIRPVVLFPRHGPLVDLIQEKQIPTLIHPYLWWIARNNVEKLWKGPIQFFVNLASLVSLLHTIRAINPDIIYSNTLATPFGALLGAVHRIPHIWHAREFIHEDMQCVFDFGTILSMAFVGQSVQIICNSKAVKNKLCQYIPEEKLLVVYNGFDFPGQVLKENDDKFEGCIIRARPIRLLIVGHISPGKGHEDAIRALAVLLEKGYAVELAIVGTGKRANTQSLKRLSEDLSVANAVQWLGFSKTPYNHYKTAAIALVCSRSEAFGRVAIEAMAAGTPVVGTRSGGLPEIIRGESTGLLYEPGDHLALARQVGRLLSDRKLYETVATQARHSVLQRFTVERYVNEISRILHTVSTRRSSFCGE